MKIKITYPKVAKSKLERKKLIAITKWPIIIAIVTCPIVNIAVGGKAWSLVVLWSIYMLWTLVISPDLVEYNRISQFVKLITLTSILLTIIDLCLAPGWAIEVVSILNFSALFVVGVLFFTDLERQKQNMMPLLFIIFYSIVTAVIGLSLYHEEDNWALAVMGGVAFLLLISMMIVLKGTFINEFKKRFHTM